jgi:hypothetical protein
MLTATVSGLDGIGEPVILAVQSGATRSFVIQPRDVQAGGTYTLTSALPGVKAGDPVRATAVMAPLRQFDASRAIVRTLAAWEAATGISILNDARHAVENGVLGERLRLNEFLLRQQLAGGEPAGILAALMSHYCFDVRDEKRRAAVRAQLPLARLAFAFAQTGSGRVEITGSDVRRYSFGDFIARLLAKFATQPVGYLYVSSVPDSGEIAIDNQRKSELTNRRFVTSVGDHLVTVGIGGQTCRERVRVNQFQIRTVTCQR